MNKEEAIKIIEDNAATKNNSFLDFLHERDKFDEMAFWKFYNAVRYMGHELKNEKFLSRELTFGIIKSYEWFLVLIAFHFDKNDSCKLNSLPVNYSDYCFRLKTVIDGYLTNNPISDETEGYLNAELENKLKNDY